MDGTKQWTCENGHVLGVIERVRVSVRLRSGESLKYHTPRLLLYRQAVDLGDENPAEVDVCGEVEGRTLLNLTWKCSVPGCGKIRKWYAAPEVVDALARMYLAE